ncbi:MAG: transglutaminase domain-containing protein [Candidatus Lokiarchaeota archaeon]|nr:transglutaminase domain-containing protein [Candidatus Lokiarchaeota archaeon]
MNTKKKSILKYTTLAFVVYGLILSATSASFSTDRPSESFSIALSTSIATNYTIPQSIKCEVVLDFNFTQTDSTPQNFSCKVPRFDTRGPSSLLSADTPPYQESVLLEHEIEGSQYEPFATQDRFNNTFDVFNYTNMPQGQEMSYHAKYNVYLNQIIFDDLEEYNPSYDYFDPIFDLYCNVSDVFANTSDPQLINCALNEVGINADDSPMTKARKTCAFVSDHLIFQSMSGVHRGASWAYENGKGDGSEFCDLMIALLRIYDIPARKVEGYFIGPNLQFRPYEGYSQTNYFNSAIWVEYYVPNVGWIACEPQVASKYKTSYYTLLNIVAGSWFDFPRIDNSTLLLSEWGNAMYLKSSSYDAAINFTVTVLDTSLTSLPESIGINSILSTSMVLFCSIALISLAVFRKRKTRIRAD